MRRNDWQLCECFQVSGLEWTQESRINLFDVSEEAVPGTWTPVGVVQVPTYTERTPLLALGRSRRPGCTSQPRQVPHKELTLVEEEAKEVSQEEDGAGASGSDISVNSELDYFIP